MTENARKEVEHKLGQMSGDQRHQFEVQMGDLRNFYEETIAGLKARIAELEKSEVSGTSRPHKTVSGFEK